MKNIDCEEMGAALESQNVKPDPKGFYENGRDYYAMHGHPLKVLPRSAIEQPSQEFINWHNENIFNP